MIRANATGSWKAFSFSLAHARFAGLLLGAVLCLPEALGRTVRRYQRANNALDPNTEGKTISCA